MHKPEVISSTSSWKQDEFPSLKKWLNELLQKQNTPLYGVYLTDAQSAFWKVLEMFFLSMKYSTFHGEMWWVLTKIGRHYKTAEDKGRKALCVSRQAEEIKRFLKK